VGKPFKLSLHALAMKTSEVFLPLSHEPPPALFARRSDHPEPKKRIVRLYALSSLALI